MRHIESVRRLTQLFMSAVSLAFQTLLYWYFWNNYYSFELRNITLKEYYFWGNVLMLTLYLIFLFVFSNLYGGLRIGYLKNVEVFFSQVFATICTNIIAYSQIALMAFGLPNPENFFKMTLIDILFIGIWAFSSGKLYLYIFAPRELLLLSGRKDIEDILSKFATRKDKYAITKCLNMEEGFDQVCTELENKYDGVVLWDIATIDRNKILKYCYSKNIRIYTMPKISDVILKGATQLNLFDTPLFLTREYTLTVEQRIIKRFIDMVCASLLLLIASPFMLITALLIRLYDGGPVFYKQVRCTKNNKEFSIMKFRSMKVDAEKDGVARLASKNDDRITPLGKFIRAVRIDELPQLFNIIMGDMSFIGPRPERPEIIQQYLEDMPEFAYRTKVKAGLAGYAQVYGKYNTTPYNKLKLDLFYIENYSILLDIKLMLLTLKILFKAESSEGVNQEQTTALQGREEE